MIDMPSNRDMNRRRFFALLAALPLVKRFQPWPTPKWAPMDITRYDNDGPTRGTLIIEDSNAYKLDDPLKSGFVIDIHTWNGMTKYEWSEVPKFSGYRPFRDFSFPAKFKRKA